MAQQERFAGPAPRGEGQRMPSCLPAKIIVAKFNVTTIFPERMGWADGWAGPTGGLARTADGPVHMYCRSAAGAGQGRQGRVMRTRKWWMTGTATSTSRPLKSCVPCTSRCGDNYMFISAPRGEGPGEFIGGLVIVSVTVSPPSRVRLPRGGAATATYGRCVALPHWCSAV